MYKVYISDTSPQKWPASPWARRAVLAARTALLVFPGTGWDGHRSSPHWSNGLIGLMLKHVEICWMMFNYAEICWNMSQYVEFCWNMLKYVATCWILLKYVELLAPWLGFRTFSSCNIIWKQPIFLVGSWSLLPKPHRQPTMGLDHRCPIVTQLSWFIAGLTRLLPGDNYTWMSLFTNLPFGSATLFMATFSDGVMANFDPSPSLQ